MKRLILYLLFISPLALHAAEEISSNKVDLGSGFHEVRGIDGDKQVRFLFYGKTKLGKIINYSLSPSKRYAALQDSNAGNIYLFRADDQDLEKLTNKFIGSAKKYSWNENMEILEVMFDGNKEAQSYALE